MDTYEKIMAAYEALEADRLQETRQLVEQAEANRGKKKQQGVCGNVRKIYLKVQYHGLWGDKHCKERVKN